MTRASSAGALNRTLFLSWSLTPSRFPCTCQDPRVCVCVIPGALLLGIYFFRSRAVAAGDGGGGGGGDTLYYFRWLSFVSDKIWPLCLVR